MIVVVDAPERIRRDRLMRNRGLSATDATAMMASQMPAAAKRARADFVIDNDGDRARLAAQTDAVWDALARADTHG
jgi:dephospho-CoA kinase